MFKLIATDMDGTFLRDDMTYDRDFFATLHEKMQAQGIQWVVASGNQYFQLTSFLKLSLIRFMLLKTAPTFAMLTKCML